MRKITLAAIVMVLTGVSFAGFAQSPGMWIYFNEGLTQGIEPACPPDPPGTVLDSLYIVAENFPVPISQIEYCVNYPVWLIPLVDVIPSGTWEGNTVTGIVQSWGTPQDASSQLLLAKALFIWNCQLCYAGVDLRICIDANPNTGFLRALSWPGPTAVYPDSWKALLCPSLQIRHTYPEKCPVVTGIPGAQTEQTTWGRIKRLYM